MGECQDCGEWTELIITEDGQRLCEDCYEVWQAEQDETDATWMEDR